MLKVCLSRVVELSDNTGMATVKQNDFEKEFQFFFKEMEGFTLVYALEK